MCRMIVLMSDSTENLSVHEVHRCPATAWRGDSIERLPDFLTRFRLDSAVSRRRARRSRVLFLP
jgi:hypothetical protein